MPNDSSIRILLLFFLAGLLTGCEEPALEEPIRPVLAAKVGDVEGFQRDRFPGRAKAKEETNLSFRVQGPLITRAANVGDDFKAGDVFWSAMAITIMGGLTVGTLLGYRAKIVGQRM